MPEDIPVVEISADKLTDGKLWVAKLLVELKLASSNGEGRRLVNQGGVRLDGDRMDDVDADVTIADGMIVQVGRRKFAQVKLI